MSVQMADDTQGAERCRACGRLDVENCTREADCPLSGMCRTTKRGRERHQGMSRNLRAAQKRSPTLERMRLAVAAHMGEIASLFSPEVTVTVLVRHPSDDRADICLTDDELPELAKMLARCIERERANAGRSEGHGERLK